MNFDESVNYIESLTKFGIKLGLENIENLLNLMGNPQKELEIIHIAGTNGKGSTSNFIYETFVNSNIGVGLFTTPHLSYYNEKIRYNGNFISDSDLAEVTTFVKSKVDIMLEKKMTHPTRFEVLTAVVLEFFKRKKLKYAILEVGMGGRLDSTNVIKNPLISIITPISMDHTQYLGDTIEAIAFEKSGIIKDNRPVITTNTKKEILDVIKKKAKSTNSILEVVNAKAYEIKNISIDGIEFNYKNDNYSISMIAEYQVENAILAIETMNKLRDENLINISNEEIKKGIEKANWAGRFEIINKEPLIIIDGAHNLDGVKALRKSIDNLFKNKKILAVFSMLGDKDVKKSIDEIIGLFDKVIVTKVNNYRAMEKNELLNLVKSKNNNVEYIDLEDAINNIKSYSKDYDATIIFGSLYMIGDFRKAIKNRDF
ncbi:folylpolyglutamate synthase/dihydrofolate synthase family protein [Clostridiaceae bacterium HSG29]|nr:folylpolyglutamate synthase/dihydrofolate synthase family protein [Clostridiaceae bacterium HSG29]